MAKEAKIGLFVLITIIFTIWGINFLKGQKLISGETVLYGIFNDVSGLEKASDVMINGVKVGKVKDIVFIDNDITKVLVTFSIPNTFKISNDSKVELFSADLLGTKALTITSGNSSTKVNSGDTLQSGIRPDMVSSALAMIEPIAQKAESLIISLDSVARDIHATLTPEARLNLQGSLKELEILMSDSRKQLNQLMGNLNSITDNIKTNNEEIATIITNVSSISEQVEQANISLVLAKAEASLSEMEELIKGINQGKGTLGQLSENEQLYNNLTSSLRDLDSLFVDLKQNPKKYVHFSLFGKK